MFDLGYPKADLGHGSVWATTVPSKSYSRHIFSCSASLFSEKKEILNASLYGTPDQSKVRLINVYLYVY